MKQILMALAITAFAYCSAEAQVCKCKHKAPVQHASAVLVQSQKTTVQECKLLPFQVCSISPDRQSVTCYQTTDPDGNELLNDQATYYGPTGEMPGTPEQSNVKTIVIKGANKGDYCKRDEANGETICYYQGSRLARDADGFYYYQH